MADARFLVVRLSSLGDIVHTLPAVAALRESFPRAQIDWIVERRWSPLVKASPVLDEVIVLDRASWRAQLSCVRKLRAAGYICAIDFQGLYKSALLAFFSGAPRRIGFAARVARESLAAAFYTDRVLPAGGHIVEQNFALAECAGARKTAWRFPLRTPREAEAEIEGRLAAAGLREFFVVSPAGGWRSKCWPPERYGELCRKLVELSGWGAVVNCSPQESEIAEAVCHAATPAAPLRISGGILELMAVLRRAKMVIAGDTGPLHLAVALGTPVVGLYGPTDPQRNGPFSSADIVVRHAPPGKASYKRRSEYSPAMLAISVEEVVAAVERRLSMAS